MSTQQPGKDTIYIDVDDEITAIIDKIRSSHERIVALVLPKRATVFQSIVNMKLLKRSADEAKKHLVLITSEAGLLPLAGSVGMYVAKTLQSKPEVPAMPAHQNQSSEDDEESVNMADTSDEKLDPNRAIGSYAGATAIDADAGDLEDEKIELDNSPAAISGKKNKKPKKNGRRKFSIPDFNKFRMWAVIGGAGLIVLIFMWYMAFVAMPRATVTIKTDSQAIPANFDLKLDTSADAVDVDSDIVPAKLQPTQKTASQQVDTTGQKDNGTKASGTIRFYNCNLNDLILGNDVTIPAGTGVTANGLTFITQSSVTVQPSNFQPDNTTCKKNKLSNPVTIVAQSAGDKYNMAASDYSVAGNSKVTGVGSATTGGLSQIIKVVSQIDIDNASQKISSADTSSIKNELTHALEGQGLYVVAETFTAGKPEISTSAKVGDEASSVTVTQKTTYSIVGTKQADLKKLIENAVKDKIDTSKQTILDYGIEDAVFKMQSQQGERTLVSFDGTAIAGSALNKDEIKRQVAGKKANSAKEVIGSYPGVTDVRVDYSPFWVKSIPKKENKITITVEKPVIEKNAKQP